MRDTAYFPIEDYGVVGNLETCALVGPDGGVDWLPYPHLESPSIFAAILDPERGGRFRLGPAGRFEGSQRYLEGTNVLETTFETTGGTATVTDFLPPAGELDHPSEVLYRKVTCPAGTVDLEVEFAPRFDYGRAETTVTRTDSGVLATGAGERTLLEAPVDPDSDPDPDHDHDPDLDSDSDHDHDPDLDSDSDHDHDPDLDVDVGDARAVGRLSLEAGETRWVLLRCTGAEDAATDPEAALSDTVAYWRDWVHECDGPGDCVFGGPWHDLAVRSGLVLKLLTHHETGAIAAAATTSLPEDVGGVRNWDYRFTWLRDAAFTIQALANLGHVEEATEYFEWFVGLCQSDEPAELQPLYGLHGDADLDEEVLDHLDGYRNSRPVRVGNAAVDQTQLDIYGEVVLAVDTMLAHDRSIDEDTWRAVHDIVEYVREVWDRPDAGIWEVRGENRQFVYSKLMCWMALDRAIAIATDSGRDAPLDAWRTTRATIREDVIENGYDEQVGAFTRAYDGRGLDASALLVPVVGLLPFDDDRVRGTIAAIEDRLAVDDVLVRRYEGDDGLPGEEGAFVLCSCWLIDALALSGRVDEAAARFEGLLEYVGPTGLLSEEVDGETGIQLGNVPQAFSHVGLINSALYLGFARGYELPGPAPMGIRLGEPTGIDPR